MGRNREQDRNHNLNRNRGSFSRKHRLDPRGVHDLGAGNWEFKPYECVGCLEDMAHFPRALLGKGVREVSIIGDSHLRGFMCAIEYLGAGPNPEASYKYYGGNRYWEYKDESKNATLHIHYTEYLGVFDLDPTCNRPNGSHAPLKWHTNADVVIVDAGAWTYKWCEEPRKAYARHLPSFLAALRAHHRATAQIWIRSTPPFPSHTVPCLDPRTGHRRNLDLQLSNDWLKSLAEAYDIRFIDLWPVEAARYDDTCWTKARGKIVKDHHYTCINELHYIYGEVGDAANRCLAHVVVQSL